MQCLDNPLLVLPARGGEGRCCRAPFFAGRCKQCARGCEGAPALTLPGATRDTPCALGFRCLHTNYLSIVRRQVYFGQQRALHFSERQKFARSDDVPSCCAPHGHVQTREIWGSFGGCALKTNVSVVAEHSAESQIGRVQRKEGHNRAANGSHRDSCCCQAGRQGGPREGGTQKGVVFWYLIRHLKAVCNATSLPRVQSQCPQQPVGRQNCASNSEILGRSPFGPDAASRWIGSEKFLEDKSVTHCLEAHAQTRERS